MVKVGRVGECDVDCKADRDRWGCNDQPLGTESQEDLSKGLQPALAHYPLWSAEIEERKLCTVGITPSPPPVLSSSSQGIG